MTGDPHFDKKLTHRLARLRVLIIDDNPVDRLVLVAALRKTGCTLIHEAEDGRLGDGKIHLAMAGQQPYDIVFLDWNMPHTNGLKLLRSLKSDRRHSKTYFIMTTGNSQEERVKTAIAENVNDYLIKPVSLRSLEEKLLHYAAKVLKLKPTPRP